MFDSERSNALERIVKDVHVPKLKDQPSKSGEYCGQWVIVDPVRLKLVLTNLKYVVSRVEIISYFIFAVRDIDY